MLPLEILDLIVDYLHDERTALNACCAVSKSWIPRARRHLFFHIEFSPDSPIESWIKAFPTPSSSPAHHTRVLSLSGFAAFGSAGAHACAWLHTFCHIVDLRVIIVRCIESQTSFVPFYRLSPTLRSLSLNCCYISLSQLLNLICSFPILEDLKLDFPFRLKTTAEEWNPPSTSPEPTGTLRLDRAFRSVISRLLVLPNFFRFSRIVITCHATDADLAGELVSRCSETLESLSFYFLGAFTPVSVVGQYLTLPLDSDEFGPLSPFDLSEATKIKRLDFELDNYSLDAQWVSATVRTAKSRSLRQIYIYYPSFYHPVTETVLREWRDLDSLLVQLWTSRSIRPEVKPLTRKTKASGVVSDLLPGLTSRGAVT